MLKAAESNQKISFSLESILLLMSLFLMTTMICGCAVVLQKERPTGNSVLTRWDLDRKTDDFEQVENLIDPSSTIYIKHFDFNTRFDNEPGSCYGAELTATRKTAWKLKTSIGKDPSCKDYRNALKSALENLGYEDIRFAKRVVKEVAVGNYEQIFCQK